MSQSDIDWTEVLGRLPAWRAMPVAVRRFFIQWGDSSRAIPLSLDREAVRHLLDTGFLALAQNGVICRLKPEHFPFRRAMRAMARHRIFDDNTDLMEQLGRYLAEQFTQSERYRLSTAAGRIDHRIADRPWLDALLECESCAEWESSSRWRCGCPLPVRSETVFLGARKLIRILMEGANPVELEAIPPLLNLDPGMGGLVIRWGVAHGMLFPSLRKQDLIPIAGILPCIHARLHRRNPGPPQPVNALEVPARPFLLEDMTALMVACAAQGVRLRSQDHGIFERVRRDIESTLAPLDEVVSGLWRRVARDRLDAAQDALLQLGLVAMSRRGLLLHPTACGRRWLALDGTARLRTVLDHARDDLKQDRDRHGDCTWSGQPHFPFLPHAFFGFQGRRMDIRKEVARAAGSIPPDAFVRLGDFLVYQGEVLNPLTRPAAVGLRGLDGFGYGMYGQTIEELEAAWTELLRRFLVLRLLSLGGIALGLAEGAVAIRLTPAGQYLLGQDVVLAPGAAGGRLPAVVQPNLDIVFLEPSPAAEAELSRFCERVGRGVGAIFRLTRAAALRAFSGGLAFDSAIRTMEAVSSKPVPGNVRVTLRDWFAGFRRIEVQPAVLIRCPDAETALRVQALLGRKSPPRKVSDTVLEIGRIEDLRPYRPRLLKEGIVVDTAVVQPESEDAEAEAGDYEEF